ncbi:MAG TPA: DUF1003 domain-containing protein [Rhizomicrobium sp.]|nr:DUF1003 domain-containing protein [Rhizomicrobium sp.]
MSTLSGVSHRLHETEENLLHELRRVRQSARQAHGQLQAAKTDLTLGQKIADSVASNMGSWRFIIIQSTILFFWVMANVTAWIFHWDPYPFILLNLALSFQAAYAAPFIMMSQNRQQDVDRQAAENDYKINIKAELEIELLHQKLDQMRETEIMRLTEEVRTLTELLRQSEARRT